MKEDTVTVRKSPRFDINTQCRWKKRYPLKRRAIAAARELAKVDPSSIFTVYECPYCGKYHVGSLKH